MLFVEPTSVNEVWASVAKATVRNELGIAAKVAPRQERGSPRERVVCIYTYDFRDKDDIARVLHRLRQLELVRDRAAGKPIYYKAGECMVSLPLSFWSSTSKCIWETADGSWLTATQMRSRTWE